MRRWLSRSLWLSGLVVLFALPALFAHVVFQAQSTPSGLDLERIQRATVFVMQVQDTGDDLILTCAGTGTIIRYDGLVLTNAHNTLQSENCPGDDIVIAMSPDLDEPPVPRYRASIAQADAGLDLALLRIDREFDGRLIDPGSLPLLPFVELGNSDEVRLDNTLTVVGYPGVGNEAVDVSAGTVTAFISAANSTQAWIKTNAVIPGMMSGGGAYDRDGRLIGIPTTAPANRDAPNAVCLEIEDTNQDGLVNSADSCVPIGDFINALRPSNFAQSLLRGASLGLEVETLTSPSVTTTSGDAPQFSRLFFSPSVVNGQPSTIVGNLPTGTNSLYLFFDYDNMTPETVYEVRVNVDGLPNSTFSLPPVRWSGGASGLWHVGSGGQPWPNGVYEFRLFINGLAAGSNTIVIGGAPEPRPTFRNVVFGLLDEDGNLIGNGFVLPTGNTASARFIHENMPPGQPWTAIWTYNGLPIEGARVESNWDGAENGSSVTNLQPTGGLVPGNYRLELYIDGRLSASGDFVVAGARGGSALPLIFEDLHFTRAGNPTAALTSSPANTFPDGADALYVLFDWRQLAPGTRWTLQWRVDGGLFYEREIPWNVAESGENYLLRLTAPGGVPDGSYEVRLSVNDIQLAEETASVGIGQLSIDRFAIGGGTQLRGQIIDAQTGMGIEGVTFILITEDFSVADFVYDREQIYALAMTDRNGRFEIDRALQWGSPYSVLIQAEGYLPLAADGFTVQAFHGNPLEMRIPLMRD